MSQSLPSNSRCLLQAQSVVGRGVALFEQVCAVDGEGVVAKWTQGPHRLVNGKSPWVKVLNPNYSQREGRREQFVRLRGKP